MYIYVYIYIYKYIYICIYIGEEIELYNAIYRYVYISWRDCAVIWWVIIPIGGLAMGFQCQKWWFNGDKN